MHVHVDEYIIIIIVYACVYTSVYDILYECMHLCMHMDDSMYTTFRPLNGFACNICLPSRSPIWVIYSPTTV